MPSKPVTNDALYARLDTLRMEFKQDLNSALATMAQSQGRLEKKFDDLEAGRLTRAEGDINNLRIDVLKATGLLKTNQAVLSTKVVVLWAIGTGILSIGGGILASRL
jgi:hypothetical protein